MGFIQSYIRLIDSINKIVLSCIGLLLGIMSAVICAQVFFRYVLNASLSWSEELARYLSIWVIFLGVAIAFRRKAMIAIESILQLVPRKIAFLLRIIALLLSLFFSMYLIVYGFNILETVSNQKSTALGIPMWLPYLSIPFGAIFMMLNITAVLIETVFVERRE